MSKPILTIFEEYDRDGNTPYIIEQLKEIHEMDYEPSKEEINDSHLSSEEMHYEDFIANLNSVKFKDKSLFSILLHGNFGSWKGPKYGAKVIQHNNLGDCISEVMSTQYDSTTTIYYDPNTNTVDITQPHHDGTNHYYLYIIKDEFVETIFNKIEDQFHFDGKILKRMCYSPRTLKKLLQFENIK